MAIDDALRTLVKAVTGEDAPADMMNTAELVQYLADNWPAAAAASDTDAGE